MDVQKPALHHPMYGEALLDEEVIWRVAFKVDKVDYPKQAQDCKKAASVF